MKLFISILIAALFASTTVWGMDVQPAREMNPEDAQYASPSEKKDWMSGTMTVISNGSAVINGTTYQVSGDTIIRYPQGNKLKNIRILKNADSVQVSAVITGGTIEELVIESIELKH